MTVVTSVQVFPPIRISVVMPSLNSGRYLREALDSVLDQTAPTDELIVQDGGSSDGTHDVLRSYGDRIVWRSEPDRGQSDALNRAVECATGDVVIWLNADDRLLSGALAAIRDTFTVDPGLVFAYGDFDIINARAETLRRYRSSIYSWNRVFAQGCYIFSGSLAIRREALLAAGGYDSDLHACMDFDLLLRIGRLGRSVHLGRTIAQLRMHGANKSSAARGLFLREGLVVRWRYADGSPRRWAVAVFALVRSAVMLATTRLRFSRGWSTIRRDKLL